MRNKLEIESSVWYDDLTDINNFIGCVFTEIDKLDNEILIFKTKDKTFYMLHKQDCCENVHIDDIVGDLDIIMNSPILKASEDSNEGQIEYGSLTWTFYNISTIKGTVTITWRGESNGYYSEKADIYVKYNKKEN